MIDLHSHILPGIDDGPTDWEESYELCKMMASQGIHTVVATPHYWPGVYEPTVELIQSRARDLNRLLKKKVLGLEVLSGSEIHFCPEMNELLTKDRVLTLNGTRYVLIELPGQIEKNTLFEGLFQLQLRGYIPIVAHPEKNNLIQKEPELMDQLVHKGYLGQITAASLLDQASPRNRDCARILLSRRSVQIIATDTHSTLHRPPLLKKGLEKAAQLLESRQKAETMVHNWPNCILNDQRFEVPQPKRQKPKKKFLSFFQEHLFIKIQ